MRVLLSRMKGKRKMVNVELQAVAFRMSNKTQFVFQVNSES